MLKKAVKLVIAFLVLIFCIGFVNPASAKAPIDILYQRDNVYGEGYGQNHRMDGDFDGDGIKDFVISAINWNSQMGRIFIYWGGSSISASPDVTITGENTAQKFGDGMDVGDFNGDHVDDLAVGAIKYDASYQGRGYVFYGRGRANWSLVNNASQANVKITGEAGTTGHLGNKLALGDVNQDGFDDLLIGAEYFGASYEGRAYLIYGNSSSSIDINASAADVIINNDFAGTSALGAEVDIADVTGDNKKDLLIAVDSWLTGGQNCRALVFGGGSFPTGTINASTATLIISGVGVDYSMFSYPMRGADINNDGKKDLIIGCDHFGEGTSLPRMFVFFGSSSLSGNKNASDADIIILGEELGDMLSMAIAVGDINNDNIDDVVAQAYYGGPSNRGRVYVFFGGSSFLTKTLASEADYMINNPHPEGNGYFSWWLSAGDINNDGWDEFTGTATRVASTTTTAYIFSLSHEPPIVTLDSDVWTAWYGVAIQITGNAYDPDAGNIQRVQYSVDGGSWQNAEPQDGNFDSQSEDFVFYLSLSPGSHSLQVRATDSENATTSSSNYATATINILSTLPETGSPLIKYINSILL